MKRILSIGIIFLCFTSCAPRIIKNIEVKYPPLDNTSEVSVFEVGDSVPENAEVLGGIAILDGFAARNWEHLLEKAKKEARAVGGNGLEIQTHIYPNSDGNRFHQIAAYILDIDNNYTPKEPAVTIDKAFNDYVIIQEADTIPCIIADESDVSILFVHDYERQGHRRSVWIPKDDLISYHIEDTTTFARTQLERSKPLKVRFAVDGGYAVNKGFVYAGKVNLINKNMTFGLTYDCLHSFQNHKYRRHFIGGSIGYHKYFLSNQKLLDCLLDGACDLHKQDNQTQSITFEFLLGYLNRNLQNRSSFEIGCALSYDLMLTKQLGVGIGASFYLVQRRPNLYAGLRYYL